MREIGLVKHVGTAFITPGWRYAIRIVINQTFHSVFSGGGSIVLKLDCVLPLSGVCV